MIGVDNQSQTLLQPLFRDLHISPAAANVAQLAVNPSALTGKEFPDGFQFAQGAVQLRLGLVEIAPLVPDLSQTEVDPGTLLRRRLTPIAQCGLIQRHRVLVLADVLFEVSQIDDRPPPFGSAIAQMLRKLQGPPIVLDRLPIGEPLPRPVSRHQRVGHRFVAYAGPVIVERQHLDLVAQVIRIEALHALCYRPV